MREPGKKAPLKINLARRGEIAADKRNRTRGSILVAAFHLIGQEHGQFQRVEDFCKAAAVSRGTFYKYFTSIPDLYTILADELSADFDAAVHEVIDQKSTSAARTASAVRYYLGATVNNPRWGWAMLHTSLGNEVYGPRVTARAKQTIEEGIASGEFSIPTADMGKVLLLGACLAGTLDILKGRSRPAYPEEMAFAILLGLGTKRAIAQKAVADALPVLRPVEETSSASPVNYWAEIMPRGGEAKGEA